MLPGLSSLPLSTALDALRRGDFTVIALTEACLHQIERLNPEINAVLTPTPELALTQAERVDRALVAPNPERLPLQGLPLLLKDLFDVAGVRTTAGSRFFADAIPAQDAEATRRLTDAGAVLLGKANTHEIALGVTGVNPHFGAVKNPRDKTRITGGSSSGSAAGVASGMCLAALGTDTGGSIRIPASLCGVVGLKPTHGRVSTRGVMPLSWNLDHVGPLTRTVRDAALLLSVLAGYDPLEPASADAPVGEYLAGLEDGVSDWRIALAVGKYVEAADPAVWRGVQDAARVFTELGARVEPVEMSWLADLAQANTRMTQADAAAFHCQRLAEHPGWFGEDVRTRLETGAALTSSEYALARRTQAEGRRRFELFFWEYDVLLLPTTPVVAPPIDGIGALEAARQLTRFTAPFNLTGLPALSVPAGFVDGLPFGLQIVAGHWQEAKVLRTGRAFERVLEHKVH